MYLMQERELKRKSPKQSYYRLPPLGTLDELVSRFMAAAFVLITLATIAGSTWAFVEFGTGWISDPRIGISFITWGIVLVMICLRVTAGWRGRKAALMAITALCGSAITWATHSGLLHLTQ
jgi:ABC-type transport system involved in cytochrome c biogenesis permease subunit